VEIREELAMWIRVVIRQSSISPNTSLLDNEKICQGTTHISGHGGGFVEEIVPGPRFFCSGPLDEPSCAPRKLS
jgi:hypothetical protein